MSREGGDQIQMPGFEVMRLLVDNDSSLTFDNVVYSCKRAADVWPVPIRVVYGFSYIEGQWMKRVDVHRWGKCMKKNDTLFPKCDNLAVQIGKC